MRQAGLPTRREVLSGLKTAFNDDEFNELLLSLDIDRGALGGESLHGQMTDCVGYVERHGRFQDLVTAIASKRPHLFNETRRPMA